MTNAKLYEGFHDDKKVEEHWFKPNAKRTQSQGDVTFLYRVNPFRLNANITL